MPATAGRNDPCPCGSGRKYKKCHLDADAADARSRAPAPAAEPRETGFARLMTFVSDPAVARHLLPAVEEVMSGDAAIGPHLQRLEALFRDGPLAAIRFDAGALERALVAGGGGGAPVLAAVADAAFVRRLEKALLSVIRRGPDRGASAAAAVGLAMLALAESGGDVAAAPTLELLLGVQVAEQQDGLSRLRERVAAALGIDPARATRAEVGRAVAAAGPALEALLADPALRDAVPTDALYDGADRAIAALSQGRLPPLAGPDELFVLTAAVAAALAEGEPPATPEELGERTRPALARVLEGPLGDRLDARLGELALESRDPEVVERLGHLRFALGVDAGAVGVALMKSKRPLVRDGEEALAQRAIAEPHDGDARRAYVAFLRERVDPGAAEAFERAMTTFAALDGGAVQRALAPAREAAAAR